MATNFLSYDHEDEDYIDMEIGSGDNLFCSVMSSPPLPLEFEFQMFSGSSKRDTTTSPADELFYKGKLLPLHLPPRLEMVEKILRSPKCYDKNINTFDEDFSTPLANDTPENIPFESCNISPSETWQVSRELNPQDYFIEYSTEMSGFVGEQVKKSWTRKFKLIKQAYLGSKLKSSRAYLKSWFAKPGCSDESTTLKIHKSGTRNTMECLQNNRKLANCPLGNNQREDRHMQPTTLKSFDSETIFANSISSRHRRSFSGVVKWFSTTRSSSFPSSSGSFYKSSSSSTSSKCQKSQPLNRSSSLNPDIENSIQGAIAYCIESSQQIHSRKAGSDMGFFSLSTSKVIEEDQEREELCRG